MKIAAAITGGAPNARLPLPPVLYRCFRETGAAHFWHQREDGLSSCARCGGMEATLFDSCPGERLTGAETDLVYQIYCDQGTCFASVAVADYNAVARRRNNALLDAWNLTRSLGQR